MSPWFELRVTPERNVLPAQPSSPGSPRSTKPVLPEMLTLPPTVVLQTVIDAALVPVMLPLTVEFSSTSVDPAGTLMLPPMLAPEINVDPEARVTLPPVDPWVWSAPIVVVAIEELFMPLLSWSDVTVAVFDMVPVAVRLTWATRLNDWPVAPFARLGFVHEYVPPAPPAGAVHVHPDGWVSETNVVLVGSASDRRTVVAVAGPPLVTAMEKATFEPGTALAGPVLLTARSALLLGVACGSFGATLEPTAFTALTVK